MYSKYHKQSVMEPLNIFKYNNNAVSFKIINDTVFISANQMAKPFGKQPYEYLRLPSTKELVRAITGKSRIAENQLVRTERGGLTPGTWMHEDVALDFAQWLSVDFKLWCNDRIKELLKHGFTATPQKLEEIANNPDLLIELATNLKKERAEKEIAQKQLQQQAPKIQFLDQILDTEEKIDIGQAAKILELPFGRNTLFKKLREKGVFFKNRNEPMQQYIKAGYFQLKERWIERNNHEPFMVVKVLVTQKGLAYISKIFKSIPQQKQLANIV